MLTFLAANLGYLKTPLAQAMADEVAVRRPAGMPGVEIAYGWHVRTTNGKSMISHNGGTGGYRSFIGFDPKARLGVVVLTNMSTQAGQDDIGRHLLDSSQPLEKIDPPTEHQEVAIDPKLFDRYVGTYRLGADAIVAVSREGKRLYMELTGSPKFEMFAESERKFFLKVSDTQLTFDATGTKVALHDEGVNSTGKRMADADARIAKAAIEAREAAVPKRFKDQTQSPGTEAALRHAIDGLQKGKPDYGSMGPRLGDATRRQLPRLKADMAGLGALRSVTFKGVGPGGADIYEVKFEHGNSEWRVALGSDGKVELLYFHPL